MKLKASVNLDGVEASTRHAMGVAEAVCLIYAGRYVVVTSAHDSHELNPLSLHNPGRACDMRTRDLPPLVKPQIVHKLKDILEPLGYDAVFENEGQPNEHLHVEYDPKDSESFYQRLP